MVEDYAELEPGQQVSAHRHTLDSEMLSDYAEAVQDRSARASDASGRELVPAMAVAALSIRGVVQDLRIPGGTLHVGQEFEFRSAARVGDALDCEATLAQNSLRGGWRFLVVDCRVAAEDGSEVMTGKSTIMIPAGLGPREAGC